MTLPRLKIVFLISAVLFSVVMFLAFLTAPILGSIYIEALKPLGSAFAMLTADVALPMLRVDPAVEYQCPVTPLWASAIWITVIISPFLIALWSARATTVESCLSRMTSGMMLYTPLVIGLLITVIAGMLITIAPFSGMALP